MLPVTHPVTGEKAHLIGLWLVDPNGEGNEIGKSSWYLVRYADGTYRYQRIWDEKNPLTDRQIRPARLSQHPPLAVPRRSRPRLVFLRLRPDRRPRRGATGPTAWIYKGTLKEKTMKTTITIISLSVILACLTLLRRNRPSPPPVAALPSASSNSTATATGRSAPRSFPARCSSRWTRTATAS